MRGSWPDVLSKNLEGWPGRMGLPRRTAWDADQELLKRRPAILLFSDKTGSGRLMAPLFH